MSLQRRPGLMFVEVRMHDDSPESAATLLRWSNLHFRDLLRVENPQLGRVTKSLRGAAPEGQLGYSNKEGEGLSKYYYNNTAEDIGIFQSQGYYSCSLKLNLEKTRALGKEETPVGYQDDEALIFAVWGAKFAIYEEVPSATLPSANSAVGSYQSLPLSLTTPTGSAPTAPPSVIIAVTIKLPADQNSAPAIPQKIQASLVDTLMTGTPAALKSFTSLYRWAGEQAQPANHQLMDMEAKGDWLVTLVVLDETGCVVPRIVDVVDTVGKWAEGINRKEDGTKVGFGVWKGEVFMG